MLIMVLPDIFSCNSSAYHQRKAGLFLSELIIKIFGDESEEG